jgi:hydroxymethylglutaryl-CoA reductase (NADPH)
MLTGRSALAPAAPRHFGASPAMANPDSEAPMDAARGSGELPAIHRDPAGEPSAAAGALRRAQIRASTGLALPHLSGLSVPAESARGKIENWIGYAQVPVGLAGPLRVLGEAGPYEVYVPLATTEGALVASYSRGMAVLREAGGVFARVIDEGLSQHPLLVYGDAAAALAAREVARAAFEECAALVASLSQHGRLLRLEPSLLGRRLLLRLVFSTGDAIGINMAAKASDLISRLLAERTGAREVYVHGQDVEKRANARALVEGRGRPTIAEARLPAELVRRRLKAEPAALEAIWKSYQVGFSQLGTANWGVQTANGLAALFLACGQDVAYVTESATGFLELAVEPDGALYAGLHLPSLILGTVGGGSQQGTAAECLSILGCSGAQRARRFAEVAAAACLAGDLSLMASFVAGDFVAAHERLGRNRPAP